MYCSNERTKENGVAIDMYRSPAVREMVEMYKGKKEKGSEVDQCGDGDDGPWMCEQDVRA